MTAVPGWLETLVERVSSLGDGDLGWLMPPLSADEDRPRSAVLMAFVDGPEGPSLLLTQRSHGLRSHAGQVAFPGGKTDPGDADASATALREAEEEVGLDPSSVEVLAWLPQIYLPPSGFVVTPVLAWWARPHAVGAVDPAEVADVRVVPIAALTDPANRFRVVHPSGFHGPGFETHGLFVWGFTAGLVDRLLAFGGWERPWDDAVMRPLPPDMLRVSP